MTARLPADLLSRSAQEASRLLALAHLDEIIRAEKRLADPLDAEALHDFRVGLRRFRSCLRAYRVPLQGSVSKKIRRRLRELTLATNAARDTEVQLAWLRDQAQLLGPGEVEGLAWLIGLLEGRKHEALDRVPATAGRRFLKLAAKLGPRLMTFRVELRKERPHGSTFAGATAVLIRRQVADLGPALVGVRNGEDSSAVHAARISAKRLRYLLEPLSRRVPRTRAIVKRLKELQDTLGDVHDMQVLAEEIAVMMHPWGAEPGIRRLQAAARERADTGLAAFNAHWTNGREIHFLSRVEEIADGLAATESGARGVEIRQAGTSDAPAPLTRSVAGASMPALSLSSTPSRPSRRRPRPRLR